MGVKRGIYIPDDVDELIKDVQAKGIQVNWSEAATQGIREKLSELGPLIEWERVDSIPMATRLIAERRKDHSARRKHRMLARRAGWHWANYHASEAQLTRVNDAFLGVFQCHSMNNPFSGEKKMLPLVDWWGDAIGPLDDPDWTDRYYSPRLPWVDAPKDSEGLYDFDQVDWAGSLQHPASRECFANWIEEDEAARADHLNDIESTIQYVASPEYSDKEYSSAISSSFDAFLEAAMLAYRKVRPLLRGQGTEKGRAQEGNPQAVTDSHE